MGDGRATIVADGGIPNRNRADNALTIYRDAMRGYTAPALERKHGPNWIRSQVLNEDARERDPKGYARRQQSLKRGAPAQNQIDLADFPFLVQENRDAFPDLDQSDTRRMHMIRELRNEIHHPDRNGDCAPEEAASIAGLCALVAERCGLSDAVENIRRLSAGEPASAPVDAESVSRKERERREWDKERLAGKPVHELTPWEQQRLAEIEWEEEWERRELVRGEREEIEQLGGDIDGLRFWFDAIGERRERHSSEYAALIRRERERKRQKRERAEIAEFGDDIDGLRRWFDADKGRPKRHASEYSTLTRRERARQEQRERLEREREQRRTERKRRERELQERERAEIAAFGDDINGLRQWFDTYKVRPKRHPAEYAVLVQWEQDRREQEAREARKAAEREQREREVWEREQAEIAGFGDNIDGLRRWFDAVKIRQTSHRSDYEALLQREQEQRERELQERERAEIAAFGDDIDGLRRWFSATSKRRKRHASEYATLIRRERERRERQEHAREQARRERIKRERAEIAEFGDDIERLRRWFSEFGTDRRKLHLTEYTKLVRRESERAEIAAFGDDIDGLRRWFDVTSERQEHHQSQYVALLQREQERQERERAEIAAFGGDIDSLRQWFDVDKGRQQRHRVTYKTLELREQKRRRADERASRSQSPTNDRSRPIQDEGTRRSFFSRIFKGRGG